MDGDMQTASDSDMQASPAHPFARSGQSIGCAIGFQPALSSADTHWNNLAMFAWQGQCEEAQFDPFDETVIVYHVGGAPSVPVRIGGRWNQETHPGLITIIPPATAVGWSVRGEVHSRSLHLGSRFFDSDDSNCGGSKPELRFQCGIQDPLVSAIMESLEHEIRHPSQSGSLYADSVADSLALHLLNRHVAEPRQAGLRQKLPAQTLKRSIERIEASISQGVSLEELAREARLSRSYFADAFRKTTGMAPHQYLTRRRLEKARELLNSSRLALTDIALQCGFSSQSHLSSMFRKAFGTSPRRYRNSAD